MSGLVAFGQIGGVEVSLSLSISFVATSAIEMQLQSSRHRPMFSLQRVVHQLHVLS